MPEEWRFPAIAIAILVMVAAIITVVAWQHQPQGCQSFIDAYGQRHCIGGTR